MTKQSPLLHWLSIMGFAIVTGCTVGPEYTPPTIKLPNTLRTEQRWKVATPLDQQQRGPWWEAFGDPQLNALQNELHINNQTIAQAEAQYRQSLALYREAKAARYPTLDITANAVRSDTTITVTTDTVTVQPYTLTLNTSWEADLWGKVRRAIEAGHASVEASAADLAAARLSAQIQLATTYLQWVVVQIQQRLLQQSVQSYEKQLIQIRRLFDNGMTVRTEVLQAESQLKSTQAQAIAKGLKRDQLHNALAVLIGKVPVDLVLEPINTLPQLPTAPSIIPSSLLERRPDIAAAERRVAAANAQLGLASTAYFPDLRLSANGGYNGAHWRNWLTVPGRFWSLGPELALTVFDGGKRQAKIDYARADHDKTVAAYRQTVLDAFRDVEDHLAAVQALENELQLRQQAWQATLETETITRTQYRRGTIDAIHVWLAEANRQISEHQYYDTLSQRLSASVDLIRALGGDYWQGPTPHSREIER